MKKIHFLFIIFLMNWVSGCQKTEYKYYKIYPELKDWFCNYHVGSYWVYQNSISGQIDTVRLTYHNDSTRVTIQDNIQTSIEECGIYCNYINPLYAFGIYGYGNGSYYNNYTNSFLITIGNDHLIRYGCLYDGKNFSSGVDSLPVTKLNNYTVGQNTFQNVLKLMGAIDYLKIGNTIGTSTVYIAHKVGLIQYTKLDTTFNLIAYEIHN